MGWDGIFEKIFRPMGWDDLPNSPSRPIPSYETFSKKIASHGTNGMEWDGMGWDGMGWDCPIPRGALVGTMQSWSLSFEQN
jgi:hypothetical protein